MHHYYYYLKQLPFGSIKNKKNTGFYFAFICSFSNVFFSLNGFEFLIYIIFFFPK